MQVEQPVRQSIRKINEKFLISIQVFSPNGPFRLMVSHCGSRMNTITSRDQLQPIRPGEKIEWRTTVADGIRLRTLCLWKVKILFILKSPFPA